MGKRQIDQLLCLRVVFPNNIHPVSASPLDFCVSLTARLVLRNRNIYLMAGLADLKLALLISMHLLIHNIQPVSALPLDFCISLTTRLVLS